MGQKLLSVPRFDQVVVGVNGRMARMRTAHPLDFAHIKRELANDVDREPLKKTKDRSQADLVEKLVADYLPFLAKRPIESATEGAKPVVIS